jgi:hypothetical protein
MPPFQRLNASLFTPGAQEKILKLENNQQIQNLLG